MMNFSVTDISCHQCGTALIHDFDVPPPPLPHFHRTFQAPDESEVITIKTYITNVDILIDALDADLERLSATIDRVKRKREEMKKSRAYHATMLSPIRRLPKEVLTEIFWLCCLSDANKSSVQHIMAPFILSAICHSWREMVDGSPKLWSQIYVDERVPCSEALFQKMIQCSGNMPLSIDIDVDYRTSNVQHGDHMPVQALSGVLQLLAAASHRWRTASIRLSQSLILAYIQPIKGHLPLLETLCIVPYRDQEPLQPIDFFDNSPNLTRIRFQYKIRIESLVNTFHRLTHLDLRDASVIGTGNSVTSCLDALNSSPNLLELRLSEDSWCQVDRFLSRPMPMIYLEHLHRLELFGESISLIRLDLIGFVSVPDLMFDHLEAPNLRHLSLDCYSGDSWSSHPSFLSFLHRSSQSLECLHCCIVDHFGDPAPDVVEHLRVLPRLKTLKLDDPWDAITARVLESLTVKPRQSPLLPMLEELELDNIKGEPHFYSDRIGSRCGLLETDSCRRLTSVRFRLRESSASESDWMECFEGYRQQGLHMVVTFDGIEGGGW